MKYLAYFGTTVFWFLFQLSLIIDVTPNIYERMGSWILGYEPTPGDGGFHALIGLLLLGVVSIALGVGTVKLINKLRKKN